MLPRRVVVLVAALVAAVAADESSAPTRLPTPVPSPLPTPLPTPLAAASKKKKRASGAPVSGTCAKCANSVLAQRPRSWAMGRVEGERTAASCGGVRRRFFGSCGRGEERGAAAGPHQLGAMDFQNRAGSKPGSGGVASEQQASIDRRERLRKLALETIDLNKDPYFMKNHLGTYECKLCLTLHTTEGNYLAHTQGKRHQQNLARRAAKDAQAAAALPAPLQAVTEKRHTIKIGRPGYKVTKSRDLVTKQRSLLFEVDYPEADDASQPRHRFMSAYEQRVEPPDKAYQYLLFACEPYETIGFKIPNHDVDKDQGRFFTNWDVVGKKFTLSLQFDDDAKPAPAQAASAGRHRADLTYEARY